MFKTIIPLTKDLLKGGATVNNLLGDQTGTIVKERLANIVDIIKETPSLRSNVIANRLNTNEQTIRKDIQRLQDLKLIIFIGTPKTGGYFITNEFQEKT